MNLKKMMMSIGTTIAATNLARSVSSIGVDDVLGTIGLERRRSHVLENLLFLGAGAVVGVGTALLFAPSSGRETRARIGKEVSKLGEKANDIARQTGDSMRSLSQAAYERAGHQQRTQ